MNIDPVNPKAYITSMVADMNHDEAMRLAGYLQDEGLHLAALPDEMASLTSSVNSACMDTVDADKRADHYKDSLDEVYLILKKIYD